MLILKFGGTSVADGRHIQRVAELAAARLDQRPVVVVSAMGGVTDQLLEGVERALERDTKGYRAIVATLRDRHEAAIAALQLDGGARDALIAETKGVLDELRRIYQGIRILGEATARSRDAVLVRGERLSSRIVAAALDRTGCRSAWTDAERIITTDGSFGRARPDPAALRANIDEHLRPTVEAGDVAVLGGFVGATEDGIPTTLGRGGSDYTAALVGAALGADEVQIWTDVDGMMTADPRIVDASCVIPEVDYAEASELAYFGAKVLHPATLRPAIEAGIPVRIKNTSRPDGAGTAIRSRHDRSPGLTAVASKKGITLLTFSSPRMLMAHGVLARIFASFDRHQTAVDLVATSEVSVSMTIDDTHRLAAIEAELSEQFQVNRADPCAIVSLVGRSILTHQGLSARVFAAVRAWNVLMISVGASDINMSFVVREHDADDCVRSLHRAFFEETSP